MIAKKQRPKTGFSRSMQINLYKESLPTIEKVQRSKRLQSARCPRIDSEDPEIICGWLDKFQEGLVLKGKGYEYPEAKFIHSRHLTTSEGYRNTIYAHKKKQKQMETVARGGLLKGWRRYQISLKL